MRYWTARESRPTWDADGSGEPSYTSRPRQRIVRHAPSFRALRTSHSPPRTVLLHFRPRSFTRRTARSSSRRRASIRRAPRQGGRRADPLAHSRQIADRDRPIGGDRDHLVGEQLHRRVCLSQPGAQLAQSGRGIAAGHRIGRTGERLAGGLHRNAPLARVAGQLGQSPRAAPAHRAVRRELRCGQDGAGQVLQPTEHQRSRGHADREQPAGAGHGFPAARSRSTRWPN